jgi:hypothetical protein
MTELFALAFRRRNRSAGFCARPASLYNQLTMPPWPSFLARLAKRRRLCWLGAGISVLILRALLLPVWPIPIPMIHDEFCYLLQADTFEHARLTNPPHPMWQFFETIYVLNQPTYMAKYPPAQGLAMALGQVLLGDPWFGVWLSCGLLAGAFCWALQGWLPPRWALVGALFGLQVCFFDYWMNSYWGGAVSAFGGALVIGAWVRITRAGKFGQAWTLGIGAVILMLSRPFEGSLLLVPVLGGLLLRTRRLAVWTPVLVCGLVGTAWLGFYQYRVTGNALRMPYREYQAQYETVPQFNVLPVASGAKKYPHVDLEWVDHGWLLNKYSEARSWKFPLKRARDWFQTLRIILGNLLLIIPLVGFSPRLWRSPRMRLLVCLAALMVAASLIEVPHFAHYASPFAAVFLILCVQSLRYLGPAAPAFAGLVLGWNLVNDTRLIATMRTPDRFKSSVWKKEGLARNVAAKPPGRHVIFVRYTKYLEPHEEWIYNSASIDDQDVIWAQDMGDEANRKLIGYYRKSDTPRAFWMFQPDEDSDNLAPYP